MDLDFTVYAQRHTLFIDDHGREGHRIVDESTSLVVPQKVRRRLESIPDLRWFTIYESLDICGGAAIYGRALDAHQYFVVKYGLESTKWCLTSSRLLVVDRVTAEAYYEGSAGDEG